MKIVCFLNTPTLPEGGEKVIHLGQEYDPDLKFTDLFYPSRLQFPI